VSDLVPNPLGSLAFDRFGWHPVAPIFQKYSPIPAGVFLILADRFFTGRKGKSVSERAVDYKSREEIWVE
jgi:hypothetical protein